MLNYSDTKKDICILIINRRGCVIKHNLEYLSCRFSSISKVILDIHINSESSFMTLCFHFTEGIIYLI